jgi:hypothetical protein
MEGKEVRFGAGLSALWAVTTTVTSNGGQAFTAGGRTVEAGKNGCGTHLAAKAYRESLCGVRL